MAMIKPENERIMITLSKKQVKWLNESAKKLGITTSKFIKFLIDKNVASLARRMMNEEQLEMLIKIIKTPWIKFDDEDEY